LKSTNNGYKIMTNYSRMRLTPNTTMMLVIALVIPLALVTFIGTIPYHEANAQLTPVQQQALDSLVKTGFTNQQTVNYAGQTFYIPYSIREGQVVATVPAFPTTSLDVIIAPTQDAKTYGVFTMQIPRHLLDAKNPDGTDKPFRVNIDGHGVYWEELQNTNTDRTIGIYFGESNGFLQIYGTQIAY
jgi:hypothetical protein